MKVTIVGAGNVGASCAEYISIKQIASEVVLLDIKDGLAEGKALDLRQTSTTLGFDSQISGVTNDYKATSKSVDDMFAPIRSWNDVWNSGQSYKRQLEIYQWLLFHKGLTVSQDCFLIYANAHKDKQEFNNVLDFEVTLLKHQGDFSWVDGVLMEIYSLLNQNIVPDPNQYCEMCGFVESSNLLLS